MVACAADLGKKKAWFLRWLWGGNWATAHSFYEVQTINRKRSRGKCAWLTKDQLLKIYRNPVVRDAIVAKCNADPTAWRYHPFVPDCLDAIQYFHEVAQEETSDLETVVRQGVAFQADMKPTDAAQLASMMDPNNGNSCSCSISFF